MSYPDSIDSIPQPSSTSPTNNPGAAEVSTAQTNAIVAIETKLGTGASTPTAGDVLTSTSNGTSVWAATGTGNVSNSGTPTNGQIAQWTGATVIQGLSTTGSGNVVLATSPTLVTPALGTPASGVATNLTGTASGLTAGHVTGLSVSSGKTLTADNSLTLAGTDSTTMTFPSSSGTVATLQTIYPVGALYFSATVSTSPATILGFGTWTAIGGHTLVGYESGDTNFGATGVVAAGEASHTLVTAEMPSHNHSLPNGGAGNSAANPGAYFNAQFTNGTAGITASSTGTGTSGSGSAHNNIQPSFVVYIWYRSA